MATLDLHLRTADTDLAKVAELEADDRTIALFLRGLADRLDGREASTPWHPHAGHKPGCRCTEVSVTGRTRDVGGHPERLPRDPLFGGGSTATSRDAG